MDAVKTKMFIKKGDVFQNLSAKQWYWPLDIYTLVSIPLSDNKQETKVESKGHLGASVVWILDLRK